MTKARRIAVDEIISALISRPDDFVADEHTLKDRKTGMEFWICNGVLAGGVYQPFKLSFGMWHSLRFHRAVSAWKAWRTAKTLRSA